MTAESPDHDLMQALLHPSEQVHRVVLGSISDAVFITDDAGRLTYICPNVQNIFGYSFNEAVELGSISELLGTGLPLTDEVVRKGEVANLEMEVPDRHGKVHTLLVNVKRVAVERGTILYTCRDITERKQVERKLAERNERLFEQVVQGRDQLRNLARREVAVQERERARISRELHDEAGQFLTALQILVKVARDRMEEDPSGAVKELDEAIRLTDVVSMRIRGIAQGLRPPALDTVGVKATLAGLCREVSRQSMVPIEFEGESVPRINEDAAISLYRVLQEALTNCVKHAKPGKVRVRFFKEGSGLCLTVTDDGQGFDPEGASAVGEGLGLAGMRERIDFLGGSLDIQSSIGCGANLTVRVPSVIEAGEIE